MELSHGKKENNVSLFTRIVMFPIMPRRQFRRVLLGALSILSLSAAFHGYVLYRLHAHKLFFLSTATVSDLPSVNEAKLQAVLSSYETKQLRKNAGVTAVPPVAEPNK
jgi:hypothetical protein